MKKFFLTICIASTVFNYSVHAGSADIVVGGICFVGSAAMLIKASKSYKESQSMHGKLKNTAKKVVGNKTWVVKKAAVGARWVADNTEEDKQRGLFHLYVNDFERHGDAFEQKHGKTVFYGSAAVILAYLGLKFVKG